MMKKLSEFTGLSAITTAAKITNVIIRILADEKNKDAKAPTVLQLFLHFAENTPQEMTELFAILSEKDPQEYTCDGAEAFENLKSLAADPAIAGLFLSRRRTGDATSSGAAMANTED